MTLSLSRKRRYLALALLFLGCALRLAALGKVPGGLNQDEASALYESWALLHHGMDRSGYGHPVLLRAWGSGQNVLYTLLAMPFIGLLGLNSLAGRLPMALLGCASLVLCADLARRERDGATALWVLAALAADPWHILLSRWALESNLLPAMLLLCIWCLSRVRQRQGWLPFAAAFAALSLYAYGTAYFFLILFLPAASLWLWREKLVSLRIYLLSLLVFIMLALPITLCQLRSALGLGAGSFLGLDLPALAEGRQNAASILGGGSYGANLLSLLRLLWQQNDGLVWNSAGPFGLLYGKPGLLLCLLGSGLSLRERKDTLMLLWLLSAFLACGCVLVNVNRVNMLFLPLVYFQGVALERMAALVKRPCIPALALLTAAALFTRFYFTDCARELGRCFYAGLEQAIEDAAARESGTKFLSYDVNMPYIYVLYTEEMPPQRFRESVEYLNPDSPFEWVSAVEGWHFGHAPSAEACAVLRYDHVAAGYRVEARYGEWCVCVKETSP